MSTKDQILEIAGSPKVAAVVSAATTGTGLSAWLAWIPDDIGKLATVIGIALSIVLIWAHGLTVKKTQIEIEILQRQEADRQHSLERRS